MLLYIESIWVNDIDGIELVIRGLGLHHHAGKFSSSFSTQDSHAGRKLNRV